MVSGCVWMVSGWCVRVSGDVPIPNPLTKCYIRSLYSDIIFSSDALECIMMPMSGVVCMVSGGVRMVSGWCVRVSGDVPIPNPLTKYYIRSLYSDVVFSSNALQCVLMPMSVSFWMVFWGVWMVSGGV